MNEIHIKICEERNWVVRDYEDGWEIENESPAGEDLVVWISKDEGGFVEGVRKYADDFDADEHAELYAGMRGKRGVPSSIRTLINDADEIQNMLDDLASALEEAKDDDGN